MKISDDKYLWLFVKVVFSVAVFAIFLQTVPAVKVASGELSKVAFYEKRALTIGESAIVARIADTNKKRKKGLSGSDPLTRDEGMFFIFNDVDSHGIWMKDMDFPIDIIWLDENKAVIHYEVNVSPDSYPKVFMAPDPSKFILEVRSGFVRQEGIRIGDYLMLI